ncbi:unnamed protein product [Tuber melanosporum]|uniref:(Perigord truffle) hypothetical protein n=1 Tax=Tuber melanosporum (strain Mel28) TaxID=656061 RepID=D5GGG4_TUBMM|nr:uncharacterized protein GSTUM_00007374001 [Tuber melanosporum]CAZ83607.1 unnamed protein product [Tuber melanosporum]
MLSTPQKVLRETLRARMSTSTFDLNKVSEGKDIYEDIEPDDDEDNATEPDDPEEEQRGRQMSILTEEKREIRRIRGRESYARRKEASAKLGSTSQAQTQNGDAVLGRLECVAGSEKSTDRLTPRPYRKKRKSDADHAYRPVSSDSESDDEETGTPKRAKRKMSNRRLASTVTGEARANEHFPTPPKKQRMRASDSADTGSTVVSKFIEGSMRDRASAIPPKDIIGLLPSSSPNRHEGEIAYEPAQRQSTDSTGSAAMNSASPSLLGSIGTAAGALNPFKFAHRIKDIWEKQKAEYIAHERKKRMLADRRKRSEKAYEEMKRLGAAQGFTGNAAAVAGANQIRFRYEDYVMAGMDGNHEDIGMALGTDSGDEVSVGDDAAGASEEKGISGVTNSVRSGMAISVEQRNSGSERSESGVRGDHSMRSSLSDHSRASLTFPRASDRRSGSTSGRNARHSRTSSRMLSPPPLAEGAANKLNGVGTLVKKKSKVFVNSIIGKDDKKDDSATKGERGPTKRELKKQERLRNRVSNLEEQLERARQELEIATRGANVPPVPQIPARITNSTVRTVATTDPETPQQQNPRRSNDEATNRSDIAEGEETEVDDNEVDEGFSVVPLSPVMNTSFGGSFNATAMAGMTIIESLGEANHTSTPRNARRPYSLGSGLRTLPKRASTPVLGNLSGGRGNSASAATAGRGVGGVKGARHSPPPPVPDVGSVPPVPRLSRRASGL